MITTIEILQQIDTLDALSPAKAGEVLKVEFTPVPSESNQYLGIFRGDSSEWKDAELRFPPGGGGSRFVLVLSPVKPIPMQLVIAAFGKQSALIPPNPKAGAAGYVAYAYQRKAGRIVFSFKSFDDFNASRIMVDRME